MSLSISGHALERNVDAMFDILTDLQTAKWRGEEERVKLLLTRRAAALGASVGQQGMQYARNLAGCSNQRHECVVERNEWIASRRPRLALVQGRRDR